MPRDTTTEITNVSPAEVQAWLENGEVLLVDVRETSEYEAEYIAGAMLLPLSTLDAEFFPVLPGRRVVLHCAIGKRSEAAAKMLINAGHTGISHMTGGLNAWKDQGLETELPIEAPIEAQPVQAPVHPGAVLMAEFLVPQGITARDLSDKTGISEVKIAGLIAADIPVNSEMSLRLAKVFSTEPGFWMMLQVDYDLARAAAALAGEPSGGMLTKVS